ncbi:hypothetical protein Tco_1300294 [Tanacetum coccineum]
MKKSVSQKIPSKNFLKWYEDVKDQDEEEIDEEAKDEKDDSDVVKRSEPIRNCIIGLENNKTWKMIVNKEIGVKKEQVKENKEHVKKGKRKLGV